MMNDSADYRGDKVSEVYYGEAFPVRTQQLLRERIHWICSQVKGQRVIDVGCSQGIVPILLAQEGMEVLGVDIDASAIDYAINDMQKLPAEAQERLRFVQGDIASFKPEEFVAFDTLIITEVIEHFSNPERVLEASIRFLKEGGQVILTTPFGLKPSEDHKSTFTVSILQELLAPFCEVECIDVKGAFIRYVGKKVSAGSEKRLSSVELLDIVESGSLESQEILFASLDDYQEKSRRFAERNKELAALLGQKRNRLKELEPLFRRLKVNVKELKAAMLQRKEANKLLRKDCESLERINVKLESTIKQQKHQLNLLDPIPHSISYRFGKICVDSLKSPVGLMKAPWRLTLLAAELWHRLRLKVLRRIGASSLLDANVIVENKLKATFTEGGVCKLEQAAKELAESGEIDEEYICRICFDLLRHSHFDQALEYARKALERNRSNEKLLTFLVDKAAKDVSLRDFAGAIAIANTIAAGIGAAIELPTEDEYQHAVSAGDMLVPIMALQGGGAVLFSKHAAVPCQEVKEALETIGVDGVEGLLKGTLAVADQKHLERLVFQALQSFDSQLALSYGEALFEKHHDATFGKQLIDLYRHRGGLRRAVKLIKDLNIDGKHSRTLEMVEGQLRLLDHGFPLPGVDRGLGFQPEAGRALYFLHNSLPYTSGGYATRSHGLLTSLVRNGQDVAAVSRLGFPLDLKKGAVDSAAQEDRVDGVVYHRMLTRDRGYGAMPLATYLEDYADAGLKLCIDLRPSIIHAASNFMNGVAANFIARRLGIPSIYEVRGLWEITRISRQPDWKDSDFYKMQVRMETEAANNATAVITLTEALKDEMVRRGVPEEKIVLVPNGADPGRFVAIPKDRELEAKLGTSGKVVIGYIGSVVDYEGLEYLLDAAQILRERRKDFCVLIVGDGAVWADLKARAKLLGIEDCILFTGRVPHEEVERYYSLIDITPYPRKGQPVCEMVSPMKPFESMCMEKAVLVSDVAALREIVQDGKTGLLHRKDDVEDLARKLDLLISKPELRQQLGAAAREWVIRERDWNVLSGRIIQLYERLLSQSDGQPQSYRRAV